MKQCTVCSQLKPFNDYYKNHGKCKKCFIAKQQAKYDPIKNRDRQLRRLYGISLDDYNRMLEDQEGKCKLCGSEDPKGRKSGRGTVSVFFVDHCHKTGRVRGLLCNTCNRAIGQVGENISFFENAILYLRNQ